MNPFRNYTKSLENSLISLNLSTFWASFQVLTNYIQNKEERGEFKKSAHFFRLAAEMSHSKELWSKIGYLYKQTEQYEQASICFGRALKSDPLNS